MSLMIPEENTKKTKSVRPKIVAHGFSNFPIYRSIKAYILFLALWKINLKISKTRIKSMIMIPIVAYFLRANYLICNIYLLLPVFMWVSAASLTNYYLSLWRKLVSSMKFKLKLVVVFGEFNRLSYNSVKQFGYYILYAVVMEKDIRKKIIVFISDYIIIIFY